MHVRGALLSFAFLLAVVPAGPAISANGKGARACKLPSAAEKRDCFTKADNAGLSFHVFQTSSTPASTNLNVCDVASSPYYPGTDFAGGKGKAKDQDSRYSSYYFHWINRCQYLRGITPSENDCRVKRNAKGDAVNVTTKGNSYEDQEKFSKLQDQMRAAFSTYAKADGCSILQEMQLLGYDDKAIDARAAKTSLRLYRAEDRTKATLDKLAQDVTLADGKPWRYLVNTCVLPTKGAAENFSGLALDFEVNDNRSTSQTDALLGEYAAKAHQAKKTVMVAINPLPRIASGFDADNVYKLLDVIDYLVLPASNGASPGNRDVGNKAYSATRTIMQGYDQQMAVVTQNGRLRLSPQDKRHIVWLVSLYQVGLDEAGRFHDLVKKEGYGGISLFRNYQAQGGACSRDVNQLTACLTLGICDGSFGRNRQ